MDLGFGCEVCPTRPGPLRGCPLHCKSVYEAPPSCAGAGLASPYLPSSKGSFPFPEGRQLVQSWAGLGIFCLVFPASALMLLQMFLGSSSISGWGQGGVGGLTCPHFIKFELDTKRLAVKSPPPPVLRLRALCSFCCLSPLLAPGLFGVGPGTFASPLDTWYATCLLPTLR